MKKGTRVYRKSAPYMGAGTVLSKREGLVQVRWDMHWHANWHRTSDLQQVGVPVQWNKWNIVKQFVSVALAYNYAQS